MMRASTVGGSMNIRGATRDIVGKRIVAVVATEGRSPNTQVFLIFDDATYFEFYSVGGWLRTGNSVYDGDADTVRGYCEPEFHKIVLDAFLAEDGEIWCSRDD
jgi:hypothetical protein